MFTDQDWEIIRELTQQNSHDHVLWFAAIKIGNHELLRDASLFFHECIMEGELTPKLHAEYLVLRKRIKESLSTAQEKRFNEVT